MNPLKAKFKIGDKVKCTAKGYELYTLTIKKVEWFWFQWKYWFEETRLACYENQIFKPKDKND